MITILDKPPVILTKDKNFFENELPVVGGQVIVLPEDAVLIRTDNNELMEKGEL